MIKFRQLFDLAGFRITNVGTPTASSDAATKGYVDYSVGVHNVTTVTASYTATDSDGIIFVNAASGTLTLPSASSAGSGRTYYVKNINATSLTIASGGGTIDGSASVVVGQWAARTVVSDGTNWYII